MKRKALVIGLGVSGIASSEFLVAKGFEVVAIDRKKTDFANLLKLQVKLLEEKEAPSLEGFSLVVISPGVSHSHPQIQEALQRGIEVIGEAELAFRYMDQKAVAITGTNGKTTVTLLVEHILRFAGKKAKALGNIGTPLTSYFLSQDPDEIIVAELSSYQLETMSSCVFDAGVILNITPDHLDRYRSMEEYAKAKGRLSLCVKEEKDLFIHDSISKTYGDLFSKNVSIFGENEAFSLLPQEIGKHDRLNAFAAWVLCEKMGVTKEMFLEGFSAFQKPPHRIEFVADFQGVSYFDDSKGTNVDAVISAVESMPGPIVLIAGGVDKGSSYLPWKEAFEGKVKQILLIGQSALKIQGELGLFFNVKIVDSLENAVKTACSLASPGDCVLLSPGCSSFDMFRDYAERGNEFQRYVRLLERSKGK